MKEIEDVVELYGRVYHLWQVDSGGKLPLGNPKLMTSFTAANQFEFEKAVGSGMLDSGPTGRGRGS